MSEAVISVVCPNCGLCSDRVDARLAGRVVRCSKCATRFPVAPAATPAQAPAPTPAAATPAPTVAEAGAPAPTRPESPGVPAAVAPLAARLDWQPGEVLLGLYEVLGILGQGGMGRVYRVRHKGWNLDLAAKVPLGTALEAAGGADLFESEAQTWVRLGLHPHVVTCHYVRRFEGIPLVFAEFVDAGSLSQAIREGRLQELDSMLDAAIQVAWGLHYAHEQGLVHLDVKPANVMLTGDGLAKVTDFGLARARSARPLGAGAGRGAGGPADLTLSVQGGGGYTPAYVSPEQADGRTLTRRADLWSWGLSVLEMFTGGRSWEFGPAAPEVLEAFLDGGGFTPGIAAMPDRVGELLRRCLREDPEERPHTLAAAADELVEVYQLEVGRPYPRTQPKAGGGTADSLNNRAVSLLDLGRGREAGALWDQAIKAEPDHIEATANRLLAGWLEGRLADQDVLRPLEAVRTTHASVARAHLLPGRFYRVIGDAARAAACLRQAERAGSTEPPGEGDSDREDAAPAILRGLGTACAALTLTPDGTRLLAASGRDLKVLDLQPGAVPQTVKATDSSISALAVTPDARFVLIASDEGIQVWDLAALRPVRSFPRHTGTVNAVAISSDGRRAVSGGSDRTVRLWDLVAGRCLLVLEGHKDAVTSVAAGSSVAVSGARDGTVRLWHLTDGHGLGVLEGHQGRVAAVALSEARARVLSAGEDHVVRDFGLRSHELVRAYRSHSRGVTALALSPEGTVAFSGSLDATVRCWDLEGERLRGLVRLDGAVTAVAVGPSGPALAAHGTTISAVHPEGWRAPAFVLARPVSAVEAVRLEGSFESRLDQAKASLGRG
jgi:serine/threonine protein kinase